MAPGLRWLTAIWGYRGLDLGVTGALTLRFTEALRVTEALSLGLEALTLGLQRSCPWGYRGLDLGVTEVLTLGLETLRFTEAMTLRVTEVLSLGLEALTLGLQRSCPWGYRGLDLGVTEVLTLGLETLTLRLQRP